LYFDIFQQSTGGLFGAKPGGFGSATSIGGTGGGLSFGQQQQTTGSLFNKPAASTSGFAFGQPQTTGFGKSCCTIWMNFIYH